MAPISILVFRKTDVLSLLLDQATPKWSECCYFDLKDTYDDQNPKLTRTQDGGYQLY